jgi:transcriptional regulator NrdR family protein
MKCLNILCDYAKTRVINSRKIEQGRGVLRRRLCPKCRERYTSIEIYAYLDYPNREKRIEVSRLSG